jgi:ABC-type antimicrobial peptide transport system permease subunit
VALGAPTPRLIAEIFRRPFIQVAAGVIVGCVLVGAVVVFASRGSGVAMARNAALLLAYGITMMGVCALACIGPMMRALRVEPMEALKDDV